jgi:putative oxidoreductase
MSYGLLLLRIVVGGTMFAHGAQKLFGWFGGPGPQGTAGMFGSLRFRAPLLMAFAAAFAEASGALLAFGFLTPLASLAIVVVMLNAIGTVHWPKGFFAGAGGYEFNLVLASVALALTATGPGRFSIDRALGWDDNITGGRWAIGVLAAAAIVSVLTLTVGRRRPALDIAAADEATSAETAEERTAPAVDDAPARETQTTTR